MPKAIVVLFFSLITSVTAAGPADGNGGKVVFNFSELGIPVDCDMDEAADLSLDFIGWIQGKTYQGDGNRNVELTVFHLDAIYTNDSGGTWTWRDRGPDRLYFVEDEGGNPRLIITITGRSDLNIIGHIVADLETEEILLEAGRHPFGGELLEASPDDFACELLFL